MKKRIFITATAILTLLICMVIGKAEVKAVSPESDFITNNAGMITVYKGSDGVVNIPATIEGR